MPTTVAPATLLEQAEAAAAAAEAKAKELQEQLASVEHGAHLLRLEASRLKQEAERP